MNKVYESPTMVVHDDREPLSMEQAFEALWDGENIHINYPPDFNAENESDIFDVEYPISLSEITELKTKEECRKVVMEYLRGYELYK